jgi:simple sugar transport system permease protein
MADWWMPLLRMALPLVLLVLAETLSERGGIVNLGIEGMALAGALAAYLVAAGRPPEYLPLAWMAAGLTGIALGVLTGYFVIERDSNQIVTGTAVHFLCLGGTGLLFERFKTSATVTTVHELPGPWPAVPYVAALGCVLLARVLLLHTAPGMRLRAAGESPAALRAQGGSPRRSRWLAIVLAGTLAALAGATLTTVLTGQFVEGMTAGRGFLALCLVLFARWTPLGSLVAGLFLGAALAAELRLSALLAEGRMPGAGEFASFVARVGPYLLTVLVLAILGRSRLEAPRALGRGLGEDTP